MLSNKNQNRFLYLVLSITLIAILSGCAPAEINSGKLYLRNQNWESAIQQLELAIERHPNNAEARFLLGRTYGIQSRFKEMNIQFDKSLELSDKFQDEIAADREQHWIQKYDRGLNAMNNRAHERAEKLFKTAITISPHRYDAYKKLALIYLSLEKNHEASRLYSRLLKLKPNDIDILSSAANLHYSQKEYNDAVPILLQIIEVQPKHRDALANLALSYEALGKTEKAKAAFETAIQANPQDKDLIFLYGAHFYKQEDYSEAIQIFTQILDRDRDDFEAVSNIGSAYLAIAEKYRKELSNSTEQRTPEEMQQIKNAAIQNYKNAITYLEHSIEINPGYPLIWRNLGAAYISTGERKKGEKAFLRAEEILVKLAED